MITNKSTEGKAETTWNQWLDKLGKGDISVLQNLAATNPEGFLEVADWLRATPQALNGEWRERARTALEGLAQNLAETEPLNKGKMDQKTHAAAIESMTRRMFFTTLGSLFIGTLGGAISRDLATRRELYETLGEEEFILLYFMKGASEQMKTGQVPIKIEVPNSGRKVFEAIRTELDRRIDLQAERMGIRRPVEIQYTYQG